MKTPCADGQCITRSDYRYSRDHHTWTCRACGYRQRMNRRTGELEPLVDEEHGGSVPLVMDGTVRESRTEVAHSDAESVR